MHWINKLNRTEGAVSCDVEGRPKKAVNIEVVIRILMIHCVIITVRSFLS